MREGTKRLICIFFAAALLFAIGCKGDGQEFSIVVPTTAP